MILGLKTTAACFQALPEDLGTLMGCPELAEPVARKELPHRGEAEGCWGLQEKDAGL